jgi:hypothetical protein
LALDKLPIHVAPSTCFAFVELVITILKLDFYKYDAQSKQDSEIKKKDKKKFLGVFVNLHSKWFLIGVLYQKRQETP